MGSSAVHTCAGPRLGKVVVGNWQNWCLRNRPFSGTPVRRELYQAQSPGSQHSAYPCFDFPLPSTDHRCGKAVLLSCWSRRRQAMEQGHWISSCCNHSLFCWVRKESQEQTTSSKRGKISKPQGSRATFFVVSEIQIDSSSSKFTL